MADTTSCDKRGEAIRRRMTAKIKQPEAVKRPDWLMHCFHGKEGKKVKKKWRPQAPPLVHCRKKSVPKLGDSLYHLKNFPFSSYSSILIYFRGFPFFHTS
jgi:hypothetical protein